MSRKKLTLKYDPRNARKHGELNQQMIRRSLEEVGAFRSIAVDGDGIVRAGNGVLEQAQALGLEIVPIELKPNQLAAVIRPDLKGRKAERAALLDNRASETSDWDMEVIGDIAATDAQLLADIFSDADIRAFAGLQDALGASEKKDVSEADLSDKAEELQKKWKTEVGQLWEVPSAVNPRLMHRVYIGDCTEEGAWSAISNSFQSLVTSPPYAEQRKQKYGGIPTTAYVEWWLTRVTPLWAKYIADDGNVFVNLKGHTDQGERTTYPYEMVLRMRQAGWAFVDELCWVKTAYPGDMGKRFRNGFEPIYWFAKDVNGRKFSMANVLEHRSSGFDGYQENLAVMQGAKGSAKSVEFDSVRPSNVLRIVSDQTSNAETAGHPARYPPKLAEFCVLCTTEEGDLVVDPFGGSGSTLMACEVNGRECYTMELLPKYGAAILERCKINGMEPRLSGPAPKKSNSSEVGGSKKASRPKK